MNISSMISRVTWLCFFCLLISFEAASAQRKISEEAQIFQQLRDGVFTIFGDRGHGSGFLIDSSGIVLTNQHVIANSKHIKVQINDSTIVPAAVLLEDPKKDVAILRVHPEFVVALSVLRFRQDTADFVIEGEQVLAIGSPLNQIRIVTSGIISKVEPNVLISDININPGNSGGPLINFDKEVVGLTTFIESGASGPGVSGIIRIDKCFSLIDSAKFLAASAAPLGVERLPTMPKEMYPLSALEQIPLDKTLDTKPYLLEKNGFNIVVSTPPFNYWKSKHDEVLLARKRQKREAKGQAEETERYNPHEDLREYVQTVGLRKPVAIIYIIPKEGQTKGSVWRNLLGSFSAFSGKPYYGNYEFEFKGDLKDMVLFRNNEPVKEIHRGMSFMTLDFYKLKGEDLARYGYFIFPYEMFEPTDGNWPTLKLEITKIDKPNQPEVLTIPQKTIERVWQDFEPCLFAKRLAAATNLTRMEVNEDTMITVELNFGKKIPSISEALRQVRRIYQPSDGEGRTFAIIDAFSEATPEGKLQLSMRISTEKPGAGALFFSRTGEILWQSKIEPPKMPDTSTFTGKSLIVYFDNGKGETFQVDGSANANCILNAKLKGSAQPVKYFWPIGAEREVTFVYSTCSCPVKVMAKRVGDTTIRTKEQRVIFPDDPAAVAELQRLMCW